MSFPSSPVYENLFHRRAEFSLNVVVVGGSIAGLSAAYNLKQAGHDVRVLEKSDGELKFSAGVRVPPNMAKLMMHWGIGEQLRRKSVTCPKIDFIDDLTGERLAIIAYHKELMKELQADVYNLPYADLYVMIRDLVLRSGVKIDYNMTVVDVDVDAPSVLLESGETIHADLIVGADGSHSLVRQKLVGHKEKQEVGFQTAQFFLIPINKLRDDPLLAPLIKDGTWSLWTGTLRCILGYVASPEYYAMSWTAPESSKRPGWTETIPLRRSYFSDAEERLQRLASFLDQGIESQHLIQESLESWYSDKGKVVLVGNSVHVTNPGSMNEAALSVEDGAVLGSLLSRLRTDSTEEILRFLAAYQEVRQGRCVAILQTDVELLTFSSLPPGPARDERNEGFKKTSQNQALDWENVDEDVLRSAWEEFRSSFGYEAYDAADDWWIDWGVLVLRLGAAAAAESDSGSETGTQSRGARTSIINGLQKETVVTTVGN
ncbi:hypothetical protein ACEPAH_1866 [Sanghuangporus vaninii]